MTDDPLTAWRLLPAKDIRLADIDPADTRHLPKKEEALERLTVDAARINKLQNILFAERRRSLLVILQGMDTSGKDGTIRAVFAATGPQGVTVKSFGRPTEEESSHDVLWRVHAACPGHGEIAIFNRSHYEDVLAAKVRKLVAAETIETRYDHLNAFERLLVASGTVILKFMLHISADAQRERLQARLEDPHKNWKFEPGDLQDRALFQRYMEAYQIVLDRCSTKAAPWHVIPSDHKWARNAAIASVVRATLEAMDPQFPVPKWDPADYTVV